MNDPVDLPVRIRHSALKVFLLGGMLGSGLNVLLTWLVHSRFGVNPCFAIFLGTLANELFHHVYYHLVHVNGEIRMRTPLPLQFTLYVIVAGIAAALLRGLIGLGLPFLGAVFLAIVILSAANAVLNRVSTFSSATLAEVEYRQMEESFYDDQTDPTKVGRLRALYHRSRYQRLTRFVQQHAPPGAKIADLGCGNCWWNLHGLDVTGVDINAKMLQWARRAGRLRDSCVAADLAETGLPDRAFDVVLMTEVLEHLLSLPRVLAEARRILKDDGRFLITVPWDFFLGPFFVLFNLNCIYQGYIKGSVYHRLRCGHINHFTRPRLRRTLRENGFDLDGVFVVNGLLLYAVARPWRRVETETR